MCVIWYDRFRCRRSFSESSSFLLFIAVTGEACVCARMSCWDVSLRACAWCVCVPSVLQCWRVEARVCLHSEISQISYCLCSFSIHALWFTTPRASYTNDAAFSERFLSELKHAPLVTGTMMLLGLGDLTGENAQKWDTFMIASAPFAPFPSVLARSLSCLSFSTGGYITRKRATAVNTVANTSRTACGYGCTCCLTQVLSNSDTLI